MPVSEHQLFDPESAAEAFRIIDELREHGFIAYLAGGCVRDALLSKMPKDYDVATDATPPSVRKVFGQSNTLAFGASFGVIGVLPDRRGNRDVGRTAENPGKTPTEVATFRSDGQYSDGRRPDSVHFGSAEQDALRRDFTINGLFYDPQARQVIDYVNGREDLAARVLRTIGDAEKRFDEDKLRMLRAIRFSTVLDFEIESTTFEAILLHADELDSVSGERIGAEMRRVMTSPQSFTGVQKLYESRLAKTVLPGREQLDSRRLERLLAKLSTRSFPAALACLALAEDPTGGKQAERFVHAVAKRWRLSSEESRRTLAAIRHHRVLISAQQHAWSTVQPVVIDRDFSFIFEVAQAVATIENLPETGLERVREALSWPPEQLNPAPLLTGNDLRERGIPAGPKYRELLQTVRDAQLNGEIQSRDDAWQRILLL